MTTVDTYGRHSRFAMASPNWATHQARRAVEAIYEDGLASRTYGIRVVENPHAHGNPLYRAAWNLGWLRTSLTFFELSMQMPIAAHEGGHVESVSVVDLQRKLRGEFR